MKIKSLSVFVQLNNKANKKHWFLVQGTLKASFTFGCIFFVYYKHLFNLLQFEVKKKSTQCVSSKVIIKMFATYKNVSSEYFISTY